MFFRSMRNKRRAAKRTLSQPQLSVERLESKLNMAGGVAAVFSGGSLRLTGDALGNELEITGGAVGDFTVAAVNGTALNGVVNGVLPFVGVRDIFFTGRAGDDTVTVLTARLPGQLNYKGGAGDDSLKFGDFNNESQTFGSLVAVMGIGDDEVEVDGEDDFTVLGATVVNGGEGDNDLDLDPDVSLTLGTLSVVNGAGNDFVDIGDILVNTGSIAIHNGAGENDVFIDGDVTIRGDLVVTGLGGDDFVNPGDTGLDIFNVTGSVAFYLGDGDNDADFEQTNTTIAGALTIVTGAGEDAIEFRGDSHTIGAVNIVTGAGIDEVRMNGMDVLGVTAVNTGEGNDTITVDNSVHRGAVSIVTLGGDDSVRIENDSNDGIGTVLRGPVSVDLGLGDDTLTVGLDANDFLRTFGVVVVNGGLGANALFTSGFDVFAFAPIRILI